MRWASHSTQPWGVLGLSEPLNLLRWIKHLHDLMVELVV